VRAARPLRAAAEALDMANALRTPRNASVAKAFQILNVLGSGPREMTATDVAQSLRTNLATVHRFLVTLEGLGVVSRTPQGRFQLGLTLAKLGKRVESDKLLVDHVQAHLESLATEFREVAHCAVRHNTVAINVATALPGRSLAIDVAEGETMPLHCTAAGKVLLSALETTVRDRLLEHLELERRTDRTVTDRRALVKQCADVVARGYALDDGEWEEGVRSIAVPVHLGRGAAVAALALSAPASRLEGDALQRALAALRSRAERLEHALSVESRVFPQKARPRGAFPHLKRVENFVFFSGTSARRPDDTFEGVTMLPDGSVSIDIRRQTRAVFENIRDMLADVGADLDSLVEVSAYLTEAADYEGFNAAYGEFFDFEGPARTTVVVKDLPHPHQRLMVRAVAFVPESRYDEGTP
jgi:DNA-binding IclR family transcriptional regulator/enamine deaminase RidA (YjgF/YER057c/UK114 family)